MGHNHRRVMRIVVQKYGGSSVATVEKLQAVARKVAATRGKGFAVCVVVSAMGGTTNELLSMARQVTPEPSLRELDMLLSSGERISMSLLSMTLEQLGVPAVSLTGSQCNILTDSQHGSASILEIDPGRVTRELAAGRVVVVAGFQGVSAETREVTTLGRGGSDTSAVALAAALGAEHCDIFSDVDGVYSADPRVVPTAQRMDELSYQEMQELARLGARVLNEQAVEFARRKGIAIYARSTFGGDSFSVIRDMSPPADDDGVRICGVAGRDDLVRVWSERSGPRPTEVIDALSEHDILHADGDKIDVVISGTNIPCRETFATRLGETFDDSVQVAAPIGSVAAVGLGVGDRPVALELAQEALREARIPMLTSFTSSESITCVVPANRVKLGMQRMHGALIEAGVSA